MKKSWFAAAVCAATVASVGVNAALAGEITGNGKPTAAREHANSICAFSGQNDDPTALLTLDETLAPNGPGGRTQTYGQLVKLGLITPQVFNPGDGCGPGSNPYRVKP